MSDIISTVLNSRSAQVFITLNVCLVLVCLWMLWTAIKPLWNILDVIAELSSAVAQPVIVSLNTSTSIRLEKCKEEMRNQTTAYVLWVTRLGVARSIGWLLGLAAVFWAVVDFTIGPTHDIRVFLILLARCGCVTFFVDNSIVRCIEKLDSDYFILRKVAEERCAELEMLLDRERRAATAIGIGAAIGVGVGLVVGAPIMVIGFMVLSIFGFGAAQYKSLTKKHSEVPKTAACLRQKDAKKTCY